VLNTPRFSALHARIQYLQLNPIADRDTLILLMASTSR